MRSNLPKRAQLTNVCIVFQTIIIIGYALLRQEDEYRSTSRRKRKTTTILFPGFFKKRILFSTHIIIIIPSTYMFQVPLPTHPIHHLEQLFYYLLGNNNSWSRKRFPILLRLSSSNFLFIRYGDSSKEYNNIIENPPFW